MRRFFLLLAVGVLAIAGVSYSAGPVAQWINISLFGRSLVDDADASAARTTLGLGTMATQSASSVSITGGAVSGITDLAVADGGTGASDASGARTNLGLGTMATATASDYAALASTNTFTAEQTLRWSDDTSAVGPTLWMDRNSASPDVGDALGRLLFRGRDSAGNNQTYGVIVSKITDATDTSEDGTLVFQTGSAGSLVDSLTIGPGLTVGSPTGGDQGVGTVNATGLYVNGVAVGAGVSDGDKTDITVSSSGATWTIDANVISNAKFRQSSGLSVVGNSTNSTANVADITAANDGEILRRSGTSIGFGTVATAGLANDAVTLAKLQNATARYNTLIRSSSGSGDFEEVTTSADWLTLMQSADYAAMRANLGAATVDQGVFRGRLTLTSGTAVTTTDVTAATTLYLTPYGGATIALYDGSSAWSYYTLSETSISLSGKTADTNYDVFVYDSSGLTLELVAWTNNTTRATALALQNGVYVKSGTTTKRYCGTIRTTSSTGQCEDSLSRRFVVNYYNTQRRPLYKFDSTDTWSYTTSAWRSWNNSTGNRVEIISPLGESYTWINFIARANGQGLAGLGLDSTTQTTVDAIAGTYSASVDNNDDCLFTRTVPIGYHYIQMLERGNTGVTFYGDSGSSATDQTYKSALNGWIDG